VRELICIGFFILIPLVNFGQQYSVTCIETPLRGSAFSPAFWKSNLVVCSDQKDRFLKTVLDESDKEPLDLYLINPSNPDSMARFDKMFRTDYSDGPISFNHDGGNCIVSRNLKTEQKNKELQLSSNPLGLYESEFTENSWSTLKALPFNDINYTCSHPALDYSGNILFFTSNMPGGFGGFDIWKSIKTNGEWSKPVNLGSTINSAEDELFPSICNKFLYFACNKKVFGGLDVYQVNLDISPSIPVVLDEAINSSFDDFGLITKDNLESGYFSSNRNGIDQVWSFVSNFPKFDACDDQVEISFCYTLYEENSFELGNIESLIYQWNINEDKKQGEKIEYCFPSVGEYEITLDIVDTVIGKTYYNQSYFYLLLEYEKQPYITAPDTVKPGELFSLNGSETFLPDVKVDQYYWFFSDGTKQKGLDIQHTFNKPGTYSVKLGIIGKNTALDTIRDCVTRTIVCDSNYLNQDEVVNHSELTYAIKNEDYFYTAPNDSLSLVYTVEAIRSTEKLADNDHRLKMLEPFGSFTLKYIEEENVFIYLVGSFNNVEEPHKLWMKIIELGFDQAIVRSFITDDLMQIPIDEIFVLDNIQFDSGKWDLTPEAITELNKLIQILLLFPDLKLLITAHTDEQGSIENNTLLSLKRAESVKEFLIKAGINENRMTAKGRGESQPIDTNDTEESRKKNRRVDFTLISN